MTDSDEALTEDGSEKPKRKFSPEFLANQVKPGQVKNPSGRNQGSSSIVKALRRRLAEHPDPETGEGLIAQRLADLALKTITNAFESGDPKQLMALAPMLQALHLLDRAQGTTDALRRDRILFNLGRSKQDWATLDEFLNETKARVTARTVQAEVVQTNGNGNGNGHG